MPNHQPIQIIYASTSGNVEIVVETIAKYLSEAGLDSKLNRAEQASEQIWDDGNKFILATSTWEHGELNPFFNKLHKALLAKNMQNKQAAFIGLGDIRYEPIFFCEGIEIMRRAFLQSGGSEIGRVLKINGEPYHQLETTVKNWASNLISSLKTNE